ncbi:MAG TPA: substrate-binding domain-containing protein [Verrucomicrobiae bacterium]|nr:substrate-binding domain-containing protein [Verrucomicrobiae bacterium]
MPAESVSWNGVWDGWHLVIGPAAPEAGRVLRLLELESACQQRQPAFKIRNDTAGAVGELVAAGEAEIGVQQIPELAAAPGVEVVGPFPAELQVITVFSAALDAKAKTNQAATAFVKFISGPAAAAAYKAKGLDPS